jgi:hypothetical protein
LPLQSHLRPIVGSACGPADRQRRRTHCVAAIALATTPKRGARDEDKSKRSEASPNANAPRIRVSYTHFTPSAGLPSLETVVRRKMNRTSWTICTLAIVVIVASLVMRWAGPHAAPNLTGRWKSWRSVLQISRDGDLFKIAVDNPNGLLGGTYRGKFLNDAINVTGPLAPLCGEIRYLRDTQKLEFCGEEFVRSSGDD